MNKNKYNQIKYMPTEDEDSKDSSGLYEHSLETF